jgi:hypothetical protein
VRARGECIADRVRNAQIDEALEHSLGRPESRGSVVQFGGKYMYFNDGVCPGLQHALSLRWAYC